MNIVKETMQAHSRIIFNGNNYSKEWPIEAEKRGLRNLRSTPEATCILTDEKNVKLFETHKVFTYTEIVSRQQIMFQNYSRIVNIEALTLIDMAKKDIYPAINSYVTKIANAVMSKKSIGVDASEDVELIKRLSLLSGKIYSNTEKLEKLTTQAKAIKDAKEQAFFYLDKVLSLMKEIRSFIDEAEKNTSSSDWPFPTYSELLFSVN